MDTHVPYDDALVTNTNTIERPTVLQVAPASGRRLDEGEVVVGDSAFLELFLDGTFDVPSSPLWDGLQGGLKQKLWQFLRSKQEGGTLSFSGPISWMLESFVVPGFNGKPDESIFIDRIGAWPGAYIGHEVFAAGFVVRVWDNPSTADASAGVVLTLPADSGIHCSLRVQQLYQMRTGDSPVLFVPKADVVQSTYDPIEHWGFTQDFNGMSDQQVFSDAVEAGIISIPSRTSGDVSAAFSNAQDTTDFALLRQELSAARDFMVGPTLCVGEMEGLWSWLLRPRTTETPEEPMFSEMLAQQIVVPNLAYLRDSIVRGPLKHGTLIPIWIEEEDGVEVRDYVLQVWVRFSLYEGSN